ncbi:MAG: MFS transporter [Halopenitus sp.]
MNWRYAYTALLLCTLAFASTMVARLVISPVVPLIAADFGVSYSTIGLALSGMWAAYALAQFPSGVLGDKFGERRIILTAVGATAVTALLLAFAPSVEVFILGAVLLGAGAGLHYSVATTFLAKQFDDIGRAIGFHVAGGPIAGLVAPPIAAYVGAQYGWRSALLLGVAAAVPVFVLFAAKVEPTEPARPEQPMRERFELGALVELLSRRSIAYTTLLAMFGAFSWQATASFLPAYLAEAGGLSTGNAAILFSLYFVIHGATQPLTGGLSDRIGRDPAAMVTMTSGIIGYGLLVVGALADVGIVTYAVATLFVGLAMSWGAPVQSRFMDLLSAEERGAGFGLVRTAYMVLGATGSVVIGTLSEVVSWPAAFGLLAGIMAIGLCTLLGNRLLRLDL